MKFIPIIFILLLPFGASVAADDLSSLENISRELVKLRQSIENLHTEIAYEKEAYRDKMRSLAGQKADTEVRISRADLNIKDLQRELKKLASANKEQSQSLETIAPIIKESIQSLRADVAVSLPFRLQDRLQVLDDIAHRMETGIISPNKAANQLWAFVEDELMMGRSSGIYKDTLNIDGRDTLVKVLRIGKVAMFYETDDERYGVVSRNGDQWGQASVEDAQSIRQLEHLFDSFTKNIRNGQFTVPDFLPRS